MEKVKITKEKRDSSNIILLRLQKACQENDVDTIIDLIKTVDLITPNKVLIIIIVFILFLLTTINHYF